MPSKPTAVQSALSRSFERRLSGEISIYTYLITYVNICSLLPNSSSSIFLICTRRVYSLASQFIENGIGKEKDAGLVDLSKLKFITCSFGC